MSLLFSSAALGEAVGRVYTVGMARFAFLSILTGFTASCLLQPGSLSAQEAVDPAPKPPAVERVSLDQVPAQVTGMEEELGKKVDSLLAIVNQEAAANVSRKPSRKVSALPCGRAAMLPAALTHGD